MDYVQITSSQREEMLRAVGASSMEELLEQIPRSLRLDRPLPIPQPLDELSLRADLQAISLQNHGVDELVCFLGAGAYDHFIPAIVDYIASRGEFVTAYTPYQPESSQGALQAFFEFQTLICQLTGMELSNASLYEGATALVEAALMALNISGRRRVLVSRGIHPHYRRVLRTYLSGLQVQYREIGLQQGTTDLSQVERELDGDTAALLVQSPNFLGLIEQVETLCSLAHARQSLMIQAFHPISLGLLKRPGEMDVDVATGEGQPLGLPLQFGGPYLGLFTAKAKYVRRMPGRLVGQTVDVQGRRAFCLTLQTREQHIRREKATSNVCTNQGLMALRAAVYLAALGPQGLKQVARLCFNKAMYLVDRLAQAGLSLKFPNGHFFNEVLVQLKRPAHRVVDDARAAGILAGYPVAQDYPELGNCLLVAVTEKRTARQIDQLCRLLG